MCCNILMEYMQQELISMMQQKRWMCDVAEAEVKETPHLPISVNLKHLRHEHILILYSQYLSKRKLFGNLKHGRACFFFVAYLNDYLLKQFVVDVKKKTHHRRLRPQIYRGKEFIHSLRYPFIKLSQTE